MGPFEALAIYRDGDAIERRLGDARSLLGSRTPPAPAEDTLAGRLFVAFVALVLAAWLRRRMRETGLDDDHTLEGLLDEVEAIERHAREGHRPRVLGVTPGRGPCSSAWATILPPRHESLGMWEPWAICHLPCRRERDRRAS
ncbi:hypothetical protein ADJ70_08540 [Olsenella sp. oral taxon 807]|nr:hypothetical protein ADJ70_08540 [Olsenella sp. oral taxon 807]